MDRAVPDRARHPRRARRDGHRLIGGGDDVSAQRTAALAWRRAGGAGLERFELLRDPTGWTLRGTILLLHEGAAFEARYSVRCGRAWVTQAVAVHLHGPQGDRSLRLAAKDGRWYTDDEERETLRGCVDVDLGWTPSTNTLPIRRLDVPVGEARPVTAAWVRFPELAVEPLPQEYRRLAERRYRYSSAGGAFVALLDVDEQGLVTTYEDIWTRAT